MRYNKSTGYAKFLVALLVISLIMGLIVPYVVGIDRVHGSEYSYSDLATMAAKDTIDRFWEGTKVDGEHGNINNYDIYVLSKAKLDVTSYVYEEKSLKDNAIKLLDKGDGNLKNMAYGYLAMDALGEDSRAEHLKEKLLERYDDMGNGAFTDNIFVNMPVFEVMGKSGLTDELNLEKTLKYILKEQDKETGTWGSAYGPDFMTTTQAIKSLIYLREHASDETPVENAIEKGIEWVKEQQKSDGSIQYGWDDTLVDTAEAISILDLLGEDLNSWKKGNRGPVDYFRESALNDNGTFGDNKNIPNNTAALETYLRLGGEVDGEYILDNKDDPDGELDPNIPIEDLYVYIEVNGYKDTIVSNTKIKISEDETVMSVTKRLLKKEDLDYETKGGYIKSIDGLTEFDKGAKSGWMFNVDGDTQGAADAYELRGGEEIEWFYTSDYTSDSRNNRFIEEDIKTDIDAGIDELEDIIEEGKIDEADIENAIDNIMDKFEQLNKEDDRTERAILTDIADISDVISRAIEEVTSQKILEKIQDVNGELMDELIKISKDSDKEDMKEVIIDILDMTEYTMLNMKDMKKVEDILEKRIEEIGEIFGNAGKDNLEDLEIKIIDIVDDSISNISGGNLTNKDGLVQGDMTIFKLDGEILKDISKDIKKKIKKFEDIIEKNGVRQNRRLNSRVNINIDEVDTNTIKINVPVEGIKNSVDSIILNTEFSTLDIPVSNYSEVEISEIEITKVNRDSLTEAEKLNVPKDGEIVNILDENNNINKPVKVSLTYGKKNTNGDNLTVCYISDSGQLEYMGGIYNKNTNRITFFTNHFSKYFVKEVQKDFKDLKGYDDEKHAIITMANKGMIKGKGESKFDPDANITRAEFSALATRVMKYSKGESMPFEDVNKGEWYYDSISAAYNNGLIQGKNKSEFDPLGNITREEAVKILGQMLKNRGYIDETVEDLSLFRDANEIAQWSRPYISLLIKNGVIVENDGVKFNPKKKVNRAEMALMIYRMYEKLFN